jgi:hypothetical protein
MPDNKAMFLSWNANQGRIADTSKGVVDLEIARKGMQTSMIEVRITEKKSSLDEIVKGVFDFIMNNEDACFCKKLSGSAKTYS